MDAAELLIKIAIDRATAHGIEVPPEGRCICEKDEPTHCSDCSFSNFCTTLTICHINILEAMIHNAPSKPLEDIDLNYALVSIGIEPIVKDYDG